MQINSKFFVLFLAVVTLLLCFLILWFWKRLARRNLPAILGRVGLVVGSQLAMTATILAAVNAYFGFYTSWQDLFGDGTQSYQLTVQPAAQASTADFQQLSGSGQTLSLHGLRSGITAKVTVFTPPGYTDPAQQGTHYPVIVVDEAGELGLLPPNLRGEHAMSGRP